MAENSPPGTQVGEPVTAVDPDELAVGYLLLDAPLFSVGWLTGQIEVAEGALLDHETHPEHSVRMTADDGGLLDTVVVRIRVTDVPASRRPEVPAVTCGAGEGTTAGAPANRAPAVDREVAENSEAGTEVGVPVTTADPDGTSPAYGFVSAGAEGLFEIDGATGQLTVAPGAALNY